MLDRAAEFRHRARISRVLLPARRRRSKLPRKLHPRTIALSYYRAMAPILERARKMLERALTPLLPQLAQQSAEAQRHDGARADAVDLNEVIDAVGKEFFDSLKPAEISALAEKFARATSDFEKDQAVKQVRSAFGVDVMMREPQLAAKERAFVTENVALIKSIPSQFFDDVEKRIARAVASGATPKQLAAELADRYKVADDRAMLIARDQTGKYYGQVAEARQKSMGVTHYIWETSNDERVREEHAAREGQRFAWDDPPEGGHPGEDFQCRCFASPDLSALLGDDEPAAQESEPQAEEPAPEAPTPAPEEQITSPEPPEQDDRDRALAAEAELAAVREAHAVELEARLAEQEQARAERERALEERTRQLEADAQRLAEEHARELAASEAARKALEAEAALTAARAAPLKQEHLEQAEGAGKFVRAREAHLEQMRAEPVDPAALGAALADVKSPAAQAEAREQLNRVVAHAGARVGEADLVNADGRQIVVSNLANSAIPTSVAVHGWDGRIEVGSQKLLDDSAKFFKSAAAGVDFGKVVEEARAAVRSAREAEDAALIKLQQSSKKGKPAARQAYEDARAAHREAIQASGIHELRAQAAAASGLVHETLHGHSPSRPSVYNGVGAVVEEVATEVGARAIMERQFGVAQPLNAPGGLLDIFTLKGDSYDSIIAPTVHAMNEAAAARGIKETPEASYEKLKDASLAMKSDHRQISVTPEQHRDVFASKIADQYGIEGSARAEFMAHFSRGISGLRTR